MGKRGLLIGLVILMFLPMVTAASFYVERGEDYTINFGCDIDGAICSTSASCNLTISYPNSSLLKDEAVATNLGNGRFEFNLTADEVNTKGEHVTRASCYDGTVNGTSSFIFEVNPAGIRPSDQRTGAVTRSVYFIFGIGILLFIAFLFVKNAVPVKWTFFILSIIFFLIAVNLLFVGLQDEIVNPKLETFFDEFTAISWIIYWFAAGLLAVMWILTFIQTMILRKNLRNMRRYGMAE